MLSGCVLTAVPVRRGSCDWGESVYLEGLGTITLTEVMPGPIYMFPWEEGPRNGYVEAIFNLELEPGIILL